MSKGLSTDVLPKVFHGYSSYVSGEKSGVNLKVKTGDLVSALTSSSLRVPHKACTHGYVTTLWTHQPASCLHQSSPTTSRFKINPFFCILQLTQTSFIVQCRNNDLAINKLYTLLHLALGFIGLPHTHACRKISEPNRVKPATRGLPAMKCPTLADAVQ